ncbi:MAG: disulfide bond formation protein DsbA [Candidatus Diapherotrites archaeon]|uniref:Disulfide bond formation protein DsbA n=1 Tax=Candidatus Iainarchaeum sp. TaxID=3101447 RepID=A0A2D6LQ34_9ARCH|nr:disulfide bond formation protein DsbA [Candidatus Diapherotrites archaeon]|tara:strand:+ start:6562 stop:7215 length:654 start_codon:yes stop_codon:yes gene_type:complete
MSKLKAMKSVSEKDSDSNPIYTIAGIGVVLIGIAVVYLALFGPSPTIDLDKLEGNANFKGNPDATVRIVEFSDFQCPACGFGFTQLQQILPQYLDRVKFTYRHFPLNNVHPYAQKAGEASECAADQGKFWEMHDTLFTNQENLTIPNLKSYAQQLNLNQQEFDACLDSSKHASKVASDFSYGASIGINSTPTLYVNGEKFSNLTAEQWKQALDSKLA